jgi:hypothetical protein
VVRTNAIAFLAGRFAQDVRLLQGRDCLGGSGLRRIEQFNRPLDGIGPKKKNSETDCEGNLAQLPQPSNKIRSVGIVSKFFPP